MTSNLNTLKIQVPAPLPVPPQAARIGAFFAAWLARAQAAGKALALAMTAARPSAIRAELLDSAACVAATRPAAALSLRSVAAKGWIH
jgi:hypothetical protein